MATSASTMATSLPSSLPSSRIVSNIPTRVLTSLSMAEQYYILEGCRDQCRADGRTRSAIRPFTIITNSTSTTTTTTSSTSNDDHPLVLSHGSSRIVSSTDILCSIKAELVRPSMEAPNCGVVEIHVDMNDTDSTAAAAAATGGGDARKRRRLLEHQLQATLQFLLQDHLLPLHTLCVVPGQYVWRLYCDILFLSNHNNNSASASTSAGGSIVDMASRAIRAAVLRTKLPHIVPLMGNNKGQAQFDLAVDGDMTKAHTLGDGSTTNTTTTTTNNTTTTTTTLESSCPVIVSVAICKCPPQSTPVLILDATAEEELCASCIVQLAVTPRGDVVAIQTSQGSLPLGLVPNVISAAVQASQQVFDAMKQHTTTTTSTSSSTTISSSSSNHATLLQPQFRIR